MDPAVTAAQAPRRTTRLTRRAVVLAAVVGSLAALGSVTRTWIRVVPAEGSLTAAPIEVPGSDAATAVAALAVVALAGAVAAAIAGRVGRYVIAALLAAAGIGIVAAALAVAMDPAAAASGAVGAAVGTPTVEGEYRVLPWPWLAAAAGAWIAASAVVLAVAGRRWTSSRRYAAPAATGDGTPAAAGAMDEIDGWDSLSRGDDPTR